MNLTRRGESRRGLGAVRREHPEQVIVIVRLFGVREGMGMDLIHEPAGAKAGRRDRQKAGEQCLEGDGEGQPSNGDRSGVAPGRHTAVSVKR